MPKPNEQPASEQKQPNYSRLRHDDAFTEPEVACCVHHTIDPQIAIRIWGRVFETDIYATRRLNHGLKEVELAGIHRDVVRKIKRAYVGETDYSDWIRAAEDGAVVGPITQIHH